MADTYTFSAEKIDKEKRIDVFLSEKTEFSRSFLGKIIKKGAVRVNNKPISKPSQSLIEGDDVVLNVPEVEPMNLEAEEVPLTIYHEDEYFVVIEKPAGMVVHPTPKRVKGTLVNALLAHFDQQLSSEGGALRPGIVHRLDEDTSGLLIVAKTNVAHAKLGDIFRERRVEKTYVALVDGLLKPKEGSIDAPLAREARTRMRVSPNKAAKHALTHYKVISYPEDRYSLLEVQIVTGRTHQIRVHLGAIGHPVVGDAKYGFSKLNDLFKKEYGLERQFLHAHKLKFTHPFTDEVLEFESPLPEDLQTVLGKME